jgi:hypothetical protein
MAEKSSVSSKGAGDDPPGAVIARGMSLGDRRLCVGGFGLTVVRDRMWSTGACVFGGARISPVRK